MWDGEKDSSCTEPEPAPSETPVMQVLTAIDWPHLPICLTAFGDRSSRAATASPARGAFWTVARGGLARARTDHRRLDQPDVTD